DPVDVYRPQPLNLVDHLPQQPLGAEDEHAAHLDDHDNPPSTRLTTSSAASRIRSDARERTRWTSACAVANRCAASVSVSRAISARTRAASSSASRRACSRTASACRCASSTMRCASTFAWATFASSSFSVAAITWRRLSSEGPCLPVIRRDPLRWDPLHGKPRTHGSPRMFLGSANTRTSEQTREKTVKRTDENAECYRRSNTAAELPRS